MRGTFIVLEGADGSGKSRQARLLDERLAALLGPEASHLTRQPSTREIGRLIRRSLTGEIALAAEAMPALFAADRADHVAHVVKPALEQGMHVVCDRYVLSNLVYRAAEARGPFLRCSVCGWAGEPADADTIDDRPLTCPRCKEAPLLLAEKVLDRIRWAQSLDQHLLVPDLTIVLMVSPEVAAARRKTRGGAPETYERDAFQARCCAAYARAAELVRPGEQVELVDGDGTEDEVAEQVWAVIEPVVMGRPVRAPAVTLTEETG